MPTQTSTKNPSRVIETIFVGAAMKQVSDAIMEDDVPVRARHMRSIDDLLMYIENNDVECAVVDQSLPTESRGLKLVLLAGVKTVKHLIVVAPQASRAEIETIDGVHQVLSSPATSQQVIDAVLERAKVPAPVSLPVAAMINILAPPVVAAETGSYDIGAKLSGYRSGLQEIADGIRRKSLHHYWTQLTGRFVTRPVIAAAASAFLCLGTISAVSLASGSFIAPVKATSQHTLAASEQAAASPASAAPGEVWEQADQLTPSLHQSMPALAAAELSRLDARFRLLVSRRTIDLEISKQQKLKQQFLAHIAHLKSITAELKAAGDHSSQATGAESSLSAHTRAAVLEAELALQDLEVGKIDTFLAHLNLLKSGIGLPKGDSQILVTSSAE
ncbi:hypothetical protein [Anderseniella sp. Alg231-50]|uniref:hypothetical protein n=1 Tax=Anderseniella sp. Alg231-50 TaxID=1922226 RepID=UPI000D5625E0